MKKKRVNAFDIAVVVIVLIAAVAWYMLNRTQTTDTPEVGNEVTYFVELTDMREGFGELISAGDVLSDGAANYDIGTVAGVTVEPQLTLTTDLENNVLNYVETPNKERVVLEITAPVTETDKAILLDGEYALRGGTSISVVGPGYRAAGTVLQVVRGEAD